MPKTKIPTLGAVAAGQADEKKKAKAAGLFASALALLGIGETAQPTAGKMRKVTETHKHVTLEEEEGGTEDGEEEEEEEESDVTGSDADSDSDKSDAEEEEEEEEAEAEEEEEEASAQGLGRALRAAYKHPAVKAAFLAALPEKHRAAASLRTPERLFREVRKATGAKSVDGAMTALSRQRSKAAAGDAKVIKALAKVEQRVATVESDGRKQRVDAIVQQAKTEGRATTKDLRAHLRTYGMTNGTNELRALVATLPKVARTEERIPGADAKGNPMGAPTAETQMTQMATADLSGDAMKQYEEIRAKVAAARGLNGATPKGGF